MLEKSGVVYGYGTLEFRLLEYHHAVASTGRHFWHLWDSRCLLGCLSAILLQAADKAEAKEYVKELAGGLERVSRLISPFEAPEKEDDGSKNSGGATDEDRIRYLELLNQRTFKGIGDVVNTAAQLAREIQEANRHADA